MTALPYLSAFKIAGADSSKFLQSQLSADLTSLNAPVATYAAYCSPKGQVIATLLVTPRDDHWLVVLEVTLREAVLERLQRCILRADVRLEPLNSQHVLAVEPDDVLITDILSIEPVTVPIRYALSNLEPIADPEATLRWRRSEMLSGIAWLNPATSEKFIPQMLGLDVIGAVSFSKGCYPGQEIIARARHLGEVKRHPQILDLEGPEAPDVNLPCTIRTVNGQIEASLVHCVSASPKAFTIFAVAALQPGDAVRSLEQNGLVWSAKRAFQERNQ